MNYADKWKPAPPFFPMPCTGTIMDISAGNWVDGIYGQKILNGGLALFSCIAALPNMFKSAIAAGMAAAVLRAYVKAVLHVHDTETTIVEDRVERLTRLSMRIKMANLRVPENLVDEGRMFFTSSTDYDATQLLNLVKSFAKERIASEARIQLELINPKTRQPYEYYNPVVEFWDSLSGMKAENATTMLDEGDVGTKDLNMLAMRVNSGKSQMVEQLPDLTAKHGIYVLVTAHVGQQYQLDQYKPNVKTLQFLKGEVKLKRVPENLSFQTGNCYVISKYETMLHTDKTCEFPYKSGDQSKQSDLIRLELTNMRGKFGISGVPLPIVVSQKDGWLPSMSNFLYLKDNGRYGLVGDNTKYALALMPEYQLRRTTIREKFRDSYQAEHAAYILAQMHWMFTYNTDLDAELICEPTQLYTEIKAMGYDWEMLLDTRFWAMPIDDGKDLPYVSTMDLLRMRLNRYHPYWYPKTRAEMNLPEIDPQWNVGIEVTTKKRK